MSVRSLHAVLKKHADVCLRFSASVCLPVCFGDNLAQSILMEQKQRWVIHSFFIINSTAESTHCCAGYNTICSRGHLVLLYRACPMSRDVMDSSVCSVAFASIRVM